jgi:hypothetical protein
MFVVSTLAALVQLGGVGDGYACTHTVLRDIRRHRYSAPYRGQLASFRVRPNGRLEIRRLARPKTACLECSCFYRDSCVGCLCSLVRSRVSAISLGSPRADQPHRHLNMGAGRRQRQPARAGRSDPPGARLLPRPPSSILRVKLPTRAPCARADRRRPSGWARAAPFPRVRLPPCRARRRSAGIGS